MAKKTPSEDKVGAPPPKSPVGDKGSGGPARSRSATTEPNAPESPATTRSPGFPIVGIGASAGGLETLGAFFDAMPVDAGIGFVIVVHLDPTHGSMLPQLLQKHTRMPVTQVQDGISVQRDHVYVIPPNKQLIIRRGALHLVDLVHPRGANLSIDTFLRSLAEDRGHDAVCIILSGTGTDGTLGVKAIKGGVGMVMVQDEQSAKYDGMPKSAIATGLADYVLPPGKMPEQLVKYTRHATRKATPGAGTAEAPLPRALQNVLVHLRARTGHDFSQYKKNTIFRRVERRMNVHQIDDISEYGRYLRESDREAGILFKELLIGVTNFFRDPEAFASLKATTLPALLADKPDDYAVRVWVPGCASGEEAYSLAIVLHECMEQIGRHFHVQVFGTDIDEDAITVARAGLYPESIRADVGPERLERYFTKEEDGQYQVKKLIREKLVFAPQSVIKDPPFTKLDLLSCRNLLIYLGTDLQRKLLPIFHYSLKNHGILFLGSSETIGPASDLFDTSDKKWKIFRRKPSAPGAHAVLHLPAQQAPHEVHGLEVPETVRMAEELSALQLVETILDQSDAPPCVIVNDAGNAVYIHGRTGRFLEPAEGKASVNIVEMARPGLKEEVAAAIREVATHMQETVYRGLEVDYDGGKLFLNLTVKPILEGVAARGLKMVVFEETAVPTKQTKSRSERATVKRKSIGVAELERELQYANESLRKTIQQLETSNEQLQSANEELQSTNEELQSTNEELETSKEELQSLNEESTKVNAELQARIDELSETHDDIKNLLDATEIATVFLDTELRVRRFTPKATDIIPLTRADVGRPVKDLASSLIGVDFAQDGEQVLEDLTLRESEVVSTDDRIYVMRVRPYRTTSNVIDGVVITFEDITVRKRAEQAIGASEQRVRMLFEMSSDSIVMVDPETERFVEFTRIAYEHLGYTRDEFAKLTISDIEVVESTDEIAERVALIIEHESYVFQTRHTSKDGAIRDVEVRARVVFTGARRFVLQTWHDLTSAGAEG